MSDPSWEQADPTFPNLEPAVVFPGALCSCGAVIYAPAPDVHTFLASHRVGPGHHAVTMLPGPRDTAEGVAERVAAVIRAGVAP